MGADGSAAGGNDDPSGQGDGGTGSIVETLDPVRIITAIKGSTPRTMAFAIGLVMVVAAVFMVLLERSSPLVVAIGAAGILAFLLLLVDLLSGGDIQDSPFG